MALLTIGSKLPRVLVAAASGALLALAEPLAGQNRVDRPAGVTRVVDRIDGEMPAPWQRQRVVGFGENAAKLPGVPRLRKFAPIASAILPGSGQFLIGEDRFVAYAAVEAAMWLKRRNDSADQRRQEAEFRALARNVARAHFSSNPPDAEWEYYEDMRKFLESGEYSLVDGRLVPETNPSTFNGFIWQTSVDHNPDSASAIAEYERRAVKPEFRWSWRNAQLEWDIFKRKTDQRNNAAGRVASDLVVIGANHVLSMVDAFRSIRLKAYVAPGGGIGVGGSTRAALNVSSKGK